MEAWISQHLQVLLTALVLAVQVVQWAQRQTLNVTQLETQLKAVIGRFDAMEGQCRLQMSGLQQSFVRRDLLDVQLGNIERRLSAIEATLNDSQQGHVHVLGRLAGIEETLERRAGQHPHALPERRKEPAGGAG